MTLANELACILDTCEPYRAPDAPHIGMYDEQEVRIYGGAKLSVYTGTRTPDNQIEAAISKKLMAIITAHGPATIAVIKVHAAKLGIDNRTTLVGVNRLVSDGCVKARTGAYYNQRKNKWQSMYEAVNG